MASSRTFLLDAMPKHSICAEIGVHLGEFSRAILGVVDPQKLHLIDPWIYETSEVYRRSWYGGAQGKSQAEMDGRYERVARALRTAVEDGKVVIHRKRSQDAAAEFPEGYFDWVYIDGNHLYEFVKRDLELYLPKVKAGGLITGDDYGSKGWWNGGVKKAVDEIIAQGIATVREIRNAQYILEKGVGPGRS